MGKRYDETDDYGPTVKARKEAAQRAIDAWRRDASPDLADISDLMADLLHLGAGLGLDADETVQRALLHFTEEA